MPYPATYGYVSVAAPPVRSWWHDHRDQAAKALVIAQAAVALGGLGAVAERSLRPSDLAPQNGVEITTLGYGYDQPPAFGFSFESVGGSAAIPATGYVLPPPSGRVDPRPTPAESLRWVDGR